MYPTWIIEAEGKLYPYFDEVLMRISIIENTRAGLVLDGVYRLQSDGFGFAYAPYDIDAVLKPQMPVQEIEGVTA